MAISVAFVNRVTLVPDLCSFGQDSVAACPAARRQLKMPERRLTSAAFLLFLLANCVHSLKGKQAALLAPFNHRLSSPESAPLLTSTFSEQIVEQGARISLKCGASGNPLPQITWTLDNQPVKEVYHVRIGDYVSDVYTVNSYVNISSVKLSDGGLYTCKAANSAGHSEYKSRINIIGPPYIKPMPNVTALSSQNSHIYCPYSGYPIKSISWIRSK